MYNIASFASSFGFQVSVHDIDNIYTLIQLEPTVIWMFLKTQDTENLWAPIAVSKLNGIYYLFNGLICSEKSTIFTTFVDVYAYLENISSQDYIWFDRLYLFINEPNIEEKKVKNVQFISGEADEFHCFN